MSEPMRKMDRILKVLQDHKTEFLTPEEMVEIDPKIGGIKAKDGRRLLADVAAEISKLRRFDFKIQMGSKGDQVGFKLIFEPERIPDTRIKVGYMVAIKFNSQADANRFAEGLKLVSRRRVSVYKL